MPGFIQVLTASTEKSDRWLPQPSPGQPAVEPREALGNWLTDADRGAGHLLARVMVNRLWQHHLGRGIVATPNDFGAQGSRPSHPELLDWLAAALIENGWRLKPLHRLIVTSAVYLQDSRYDEARAAIDREEVFHWRHVP